MTKCNKSNKKYKNRLGNIDPRVAGIDIGSKLIHVSIPRDNGGVTVHEYGSSTPQLRKIATDLKQAGVIYAVMEATGVYWLPLFETLESPKYGLQPILVDAKSVKNAPGRKTDMLDCQWIQVLYSAGILTPAFRPPRERAQLRNLVRIRHGTIKTRQRALLHMEKALQLMNLKLSSALSDIGGMSGIRIIRAIVEGEEDPAVLADLRHSGCRKPTKDFIDSLTGNYQFDHLHALKIALNHYDFCLDQIKETEVLILRELEKLPTITTEPVPLREKDKDANGKYRKKGKPSKHLFSFDVRTKLWEKSGVDLTTLPGVEAGNALTIFAELGGTDVSSWPSEKQFASWLKLAPGNNISGGKRRKSKHMPSANPIAQVLRMSALSCKKSRSGLGAFIRRICGRTDNLKGIKAGAHKLARVLYQMCKHGMAYVEKGDAYFEKAYEARIARNLEKRAKELGYHLVPIPTAL